MQFKDLPEFAQQTACNLLSGTYIEAPSKEVLAKDIRDAFISLYCEAENNVTHKSSDSVVKQSTCSIHCKKHMECGVHVSTVSISSADEILDRIKMGESKNVFLYAPKGAEGLAVSQYKSEPNPEPEEIRRISSVERLSLVNAIANAIISTIKETKKPLGGNDFDQAVKSVREMFTPGI